MKYLVILILLSSCASKLIRKAPELAKEQRFYRLDPDHLGVIYHRKCKKKPKDPRDCVVSKYELLKEWHFFSPNFIIIPYSYVFPVK